jgi:hypothetical protein
MTNEEIDDKFKAEFARMVKKGVKNPELDTLTPRQLESFKERIIEMAVYDISQVVQLKVGVIEVTNDLYIRHISKIYLELAKAFLDLAFSYRPEYPRPMEETK